MIKYKKNQLFVALLGMLMLSSCSTVEYDWEKYELAATPKVNLNAEASALPTYATAKVSFFNLAEADYATNQKFEWELDYYDANGRVEVSQIDVYISFNKGENTAPVYPIVLSYAEVHPNQNQFPLPSIIGGSDMLYDEVTSFPKSYSFTPAELAELTGVDLSTVEVNDYFLFKFAVTMGDGTRIVTYNYKDCDESRGELADCRVGVRFKNQP